VEEKNTEYFSVELSPKSKYYKAAATFDDMKSIYMYFAFNKRANFINLSSEIQIGEFSALELDKISSEANVYLNKMLLGFEFFTSKYPLGTSDALLFQVYLKIVYLIVKFKPIIPLMIYKHLRNIHHYLVKLLFR
jgi:hypothetical protein